MAPSPSSPLQDLGALVLGNDALDLEQEVVLRAGANGPVEDGDLNAGAPELLHQQGLVRMTPGEPVGCEYVDTVDVPGERCIAQTLQGRTHQRGSAVALVNGGGIWEHCDAIGSNPLA
jgi:hypothetical protein